MGMLMQERGALPLNPLDVAEQVITGREWPFDRPLDEELVAEVIGQWCNFRIWFTWQPDLEAVMFSCASEMKIPPSHQPKVWPLIMMINERLWLGHFDICGEDGTVTFRQSMLLRGASGMSHEQAEELIDIAIEECERFFPAFQSVIWAGQSPEAALKFAMFETFGEA